MKDTCFFLFLLLLSTTSIAQNANCPSCTQPINNLTLNGDFSNGIIGFTSNLTYSAGSSSPGRYTVRSQSNTFWIGGCPVSDHSPSGNTDLLCIDARTYGLSIAWEQTISGLQPNTNYLFSYFVKFATCTQSGVMPVLRILANAVQLGDTVKIQAGPWRKCSYLWNSGSASSIVLQIVDTVPGGSGNDFIIDDIEFGECGGYMLADAGNYPPVCAGSPIQLTGTGTGTGTCSWSGPAFLDNYLTCTPIFQCSIPGSYMYIFDYTSGPCISTDSVWINVDPLPSKPVITQRNDTLFSTPANSWQWYSSSGLLPGETGPYFLPAQGGLYFVETITSSGCKARSDTLIYTPCGQLVNIDAGPDLYVCAGSAINLSVTGTGSGNCLWAGPPGLDTYQGCNPVFQSGSAGNNQYIISDTIPGCMAVDTLLIEVYPLPSQPVISQQYDSLHSSFAVAYQWYLNGTLLPSDTLWYLIPSLPGYFQVEISDGNTCRMLSDSVYPAFAGFPDIPADHRFIVSHQNGLLWISNRTRESEYITVIIYDNTGKTIYEKRHFSLSLEKISVPEGNNSGGLYVVRIITSKEILSCRLLLTR